MRMSLQHIQLLLSKYILINLNYFILLLYILIYFNFSIYGSAYNIPCLFIDSTTNIRCNGKPVLREYKQVILNINYN
jgi:hypothetical protein